MDAAQLRWWDGANWTRETTPAATVEVPTQVPVVPTHVPAEVAVDVPVSLAPVPPLPATPAAAGVYIPRNSVFKMAEAVDGQAYVPEWSGLAEISDDVALSGVPVQLALTAAPSDGPPIPVSADVFPVLGLAPEPPAPGPTPEPAAPAWQVEQPLAAPIDELFPVRPVAPAPASAPGPVSVPASASAPVPVATAPAPAAPYAAPAPVAVFTTTPPPTGAPFPGLVPTTTTPTTTTPTTAAPVEPEPTVAEPTATGSADVGYEPLVARAIPEPVRLDAPVEIAAIPAPAGIPAPASMAAPEAPSPAAPTEDAAFPAPQYQPHPGEYVPFDPNVAVRLEPVPAIPFSSRDPFNPASTSRPDLRSYGAAPIGPSGSTWTGALILILIAPMLIAAGYAALFQLQTINVGLAPNLALAGLILALAFIGIGAAQFDRNALAKRGYFDLASPFWILLTPLIYLVVRASRLHSQGPGSIRAVFLWLGAWIGAAAILGFSTFAALTAVTPERVNQLDQAIVQKFTDGTSAARVDCPSIPSFAAGTSINCTVTTGSAELGTTAQLIQVTITDWQGDASYKLISTTKTTGTSTGS